MKRGFRVLMSIVFTVSILVAKAQWVTSGNDISNSNSGLVGIGTNSPGTKLRVIVPVSTSSVGGDPNAYGIAISDNTSSTMAIRSLGSGVIHLATDVGGRKLVLGGGAFEQTLFVNSGGSVGIGTSSPAQKLELTGNLRIDGPTTGTTHSEFQFYRGDGVKFASIGQSNLTAANSTFDIQHFNGNDIRFLNNGAEQMRILAASGNVGIGSTNPDQKLTVKGVVHASEVQIDLTVPGPDYVFEKEYKLPKLEEVKSYVEENKHLPEVPSAKEMEKNGIQVGEMNMILLKKVEELTLYMIEANKRIDNQQKEIDELKKLNKK